MVVDLLVLRMVMVTETRGFARDTPCDGEPASMVPSCLGLPPAGRSTFSEVPMSLLTRSDVGF